MAEAQIAEHAKPTFGVANAFLGIIAGQIVLWTVIPALVFENVPLDVAENIAWAREWQLGYYKHPPLQAWLTGAALELSDGAIWSVYLLSQLAVALCFIFIWLMGRKVVDERGRLLAVAFFSLVYYANIPTPEFNANVLQMPIWAAAPYLLWRAMNARGLGWWIGLGAVIALAFYAKYSAVFLVSALAVALLILPRGRAALARPGPYIGAAVALALFTPQLLWLVQHDFQPFAWAGARSAQLHGLGRITRAAGFLLAQLADHAGALAMVAAGMAGRVAWGRRGHSWRRFSDAERYVFALAFAPVTITVLSSLVSGRGLRDMWAAPMFCYTGLAAAIWLAPRFDRLRHRAMIAVWAALFVAAPVGVGLSVVLGSAYAKRPARTALYGSELAAKAEKIWAAHTGGHPLAIVAGPTWEASVAVANSHRHPSAFIDGDFAKNPWVTPERLAKEGALVLWPERHAEHWAATFAKLGRFSAMGTFTIPYRYGTKTALIHWAILPPAAARNGDSP